MRLFFALYPPEEVRLQLAAITKELSVRMALESKRWYSADDLHLTLAFIGDADDARRRCLSNAAQTVRGQAFKLLIDCTGYFSNAKVLWLGCTGKPLQLINLVDQLNPALMPCGYSAPREFHPHITIKRRAAPPPKQVNFVPVAWRVEDFCLMESVQPVSGQRYRVIETFLLH